MTFIERGINPSAGIQNQEFILRPIVAADAELDYDAVMDSRAFLRTWDQSTWPEDDFTVEANREDMVKLEQRYVSGESFSYTIMNPNETECLGCVYIFAADVGWFSGAEVTEIGADRWSDCDAMVYFWVRSSRLAEGMDRRVLDSLLEWFEQKWKFDAVIVVTNELLDQQVAMIEATDLRRRFEVKLPADPGRYLAYA